jgi:hypothetical protein
MTERRMEAYYYEFKPTGVDCIDKILSAVACAGKAYQSTEDWYEDCYPWDDHTGMTPVEWIQNAANEASRTLTDGLKSATADSVEDAVGALYTQLYRLRKSGNYQEEYEVMQALSNMLIRDMAFLREKYNVHN